MKWKMSERDPPQSTWKELPAAVKWMLPKQLLCVCAFQSVLIWGINTPYHNPTEVLSCFKIGNGFLSNLSSTLSPHFQRKTFPLSLTQSYLLQQIQISNSSTFMGHNDSLSAWAFLQLLLQCCFPPSQPAGGQASVWVMWQLWPCELSVSSPASSKSSSVVMNTGKTVFTLTNTLKMANTVYGLKWSSQNFCSAPLVFLRNRFKIHRPLLGLPS